MSKCRGAAGFCRGTSAEDVVHRCWNKGRTEVVGGAEVLVQEVGGAGCRGGTEVVQRCCVGADDQVQDSVEVVQRWCRGGVELVQG